ncbi:MAG: 50S ribosomal protein L6 [Patescibacteria group bacterium]
MSKIGRKIIKIPDSVNFEIQGQKLLAKGPKGELTLQLSERLAIQKLNQEIKVSKKSDDKYTKALHGLYWKLIANMIEGVNIGFEKKLQFTGVGFRAEVQGDKLILNLGYSHSSEIIAKANISFKVEKNIITVSGIDRQVVGQQAADIRSLRPVEPYKGKGIKYLDEIPRKKPGKAAKATIAGA